MTHDELMQAVADPATRARIEHRIKAGGSWTTGLDVPISESFFNPDNWRLAPEPLPPGEISREEASKLWNEGVAVQGDRSTIGSGDFHDIIPKRIAKTMESDPIFWPKDRRFRRTPAPPPPRMVELGPEDIDLHQDLFRHISCGPPEDATIATRKTVEHIWVYDVPVTWNMLRKSLLRSTDGGKTWEPCEKEAKE